MKVPIQNLYYLFCYAWQFIPADVAIDVGVVDCPDILNLCGHVLLTGIDRILRRGLDRGYQQHVGESARVRGRIDVTETMNAVSWLSGRLVCRYEDLSPEVLHNQILLSTVRMLASAPSVDQGLRDRLHEADQRLAGITPIFLTDAVFRRFQLHRNNGFYAFLMRVCELVHLSLLADHEGKGRASFRDVLSDEAYMATVFEEFVRNFFSLKQKRFTVRRTRPRWNATADHPDQLGFLPSMMTDVTLCSPDRTIIIDAKYYRAALQTHFGAKTIHSANLYQLMAYLHGTTVATKPPSILEGVLIYPVGEHAADLRLKIDGYPVRVYTLNLAQTWYAIEAELLKLVEAAPAPVTTMVVDRS